MISVDGVGPSAMASELARGTTYDGATLPLVARTPVVPGATNVLFLTLFDQGDDIFDSAVFVDNLRYERTSPRAGASRWPSTRSRAPPGWS